MDSIYKQAFSETLAVLENTDKSILEKISPQFIDFLKENKDDQYIVNIDFSKDNWEDSILQETQGILALIYRDYIVSPEERAKLIKEEKEEQIRIETEKREKYNPDNIFKNETIENNEIKALVKHKEESFIQKLIAKIKSFIRKK